MKLQQTNENANKNNKKKASIELTNYVRLFNTRGERYVHEITPHIDTSKISFGQ